MDPFSYLSFLTSIVLGLGVARVLTGVGRLLQARQRVRHYWVHLLWALNVFLYLLLDWWILYRWSSQVGWSFFLFIFVLLTPTVTYLLAVVLLPDPLEHGTDLKQHFYNNRRVFFALASTLPLLDVVDTLLKGWGHFLAQGPAYFITIPLLFGLTIAATFTDNEHFHERFSVFFLVYILTFITINLRTLI